VTCKNLSNGYFLRLERGEDIVNTLENFTRERNLKSGSIQAIGAVSSIELGFYHLNKKEYSWKKYDQNLEIAALTGNIAYSNGEVVIHLHGVFANEDNSCFGGHVKNAKVSATCEVYIMEFDKLLTRSFNDEIGLKLIDLES
jgi:predicted DNA-binding protein with PD1-like motif